MSGPTPPKHEATHRSDGGRYRKHYNYLMFGGAFFAIAWLIWTFFFSNALLK